MSSLRERLRRARGEPEPTPAPQANALADERPDLAARLRRLGAARAGAQGAAVAERTPDVQAPPAVMRGAGQRRVPDDAALALALGAERLGPGVLRLTRTAPLGQGVARPDPRAVAELLGAQVPPPSDWLALDTETSGLAGGTGTWVFMVGLARWQAAGLETTQFLLTRLDAERAFLEQVAVALAGTGLLLTYNGKTFDLPLLAARLRLARLADLPAGTAHLDLLHPVRRAFATRWPDCRLATAEQRLLGQPRSGDLPGAEAPAAWLAWLRRGEHRGLAGVLAHNRVDLLSVAALPAALAAAHRSPARRGADPLRIARWRLGAGDPVGARALLLGAGEAALDAAGRRLLARLHGRLGDWGAAVALWERLAAAGDAEAREALAKHFEHREGDPRRALAHAERLPVSAGSARRRQRLLDKLGRPAVFRRGRD